MSKQTILISQIQEKKEDNCGKNTALTTST